MSDTKPTKLRVLTPLLFPLVMIAGMYIGFSLKDSLRAKRSERLDELIGLIDDKYVDTVNNDQLYKDAVEGMLKHLDPHTVYIPPEDLQEVKESLGGSFGGIGVQFGIFKDTVLVVSVIEKGPAEKAGIAVGDKFIKVNDSVVAGKGITSDRIQNMLRGKTATSVILILKDAISGKNKIITVTRGDIPLYSVDAGIMLDNETGFIKINRFSATTFDEFMTALKKLKQAGMKQLILDLRDNPGGYMEAATNIADQFLDGKKMIVYTEGKKMPREDVECSETGLFEQGELIILVDENSASATEILAGAIQDWDRGVIIGRQSFGKGLVQRQYELRDGSALRLTIAKYYTPSGRSIQRTYAKGKEAYAADFKKRYEDGELTGNDSLAMHDTVKYYTANHRLVYGGGGIKPDVYVPYDTSGNKGLYQLVLSEDLQKVIWDYFSLNIAALKKYKNAKDLEAQFAGSDVIVDAYLQSLNTFDKAAATKILELPANKTYMERQVKAQLARILFWESGYYYIHSKGDRVVQKALQSFQKDVYSKLIGR